MIEINCDTSKETIIINELIHNGTLNCSDEFIKKAWSVVGKELSLTYGTLFGKGIIF